MSASLLPTSACRRTVLEALAGNVPCGGPHVQGVRRRALAWPASDERITLLVYGIGYEGRDPEQFVRTLVAAGVEVLVDVRLNASSRKRGFAKTALSRALHSAGVDYLHLRALGNEKDNRDGFGHRTGEQAEGARSRYLAHLRNGSAAAVNDLLEVLEERPAALLCFERDERHCHREVLIQHLQELQPKLVALPL